MKKKAKKKTACTKGRHAFRYFGGEARCTKCGRYLQPSGKVTRKA